MGLQFSSTEGNVDFFWVYVESHIFFPLQTLYRAQKILLKVLQVRFTKLLPLPFPQASARIKVKWK